MRSEITAAAVARLNELAEKSGGITSLAQRSGIPRRTLSNYLSGRNDIPLTALIAMAQATGASIEWIANGTEAGRDSALLGRESAAQRQAAVASDPELMGRVVSAIAKLYRTEKVSLPDVDLGRLAMQGYAEIVEEAEDPDEYPARIELMVVRLRKALRTAAASPDTSKRRA